VGQQGHYHPFGESWYAQNTTTNWQFTSYERDSESTNDYAMARFYANSLGRFSSPDPAGLDGISSRAACGRPGNFQGPFRARPKADIPPYFSTICS
jgi:RHS repeat-associated protein